MVADEATLLFRTVVVGTAKVLHALATPPSLDKATHELPQVAFFENLTKTMYGERETLTYLDLHSHARIRQKSRHSWCNGRSVGNKQVALKIHHKQ
ncbi:hypothetical protein GQ600_22997 [Phytophthora cactorum]|nr:hypothetical protein GQ600_22997 [Phytophthora cactorum]